MKIFTLIYYIPGLIFFFFGNLSFCQEHNQNDISAEIFNYPVLKGKNYNPVMRVKINTEKETNAIGTFTVGAHSTKPKEIEGVKIFFTGTDPDFSTQIPFGVGISKEEVQSITDTLNLEKGENYFWVSIDLSDNADLLSQLSIRLESVIIGDLKYTEVVHCNEQRLRTGVALRQHGDEGVHTYRIPGLATSKEGTLLATYDVRYESGRDLQGHMDIGVSRSIDEGESWEPLRIALDMNKFGGLPEKFNGVSDACILVDEKSGDIYIAGLWMHGVINSEGKWVKGLTQESEEWNHQWRDRGSQPGLGIRETSQFLITKSTDDGKTWSAPINLTKMLKKPEWWLLAPGPGHGITLKDGTLVFPTQGRDALGESFSNITYSKDGGKTWRTSNPAATNTTEAMAVQLSNGSIMLNMRDNRNATDKSENNGRNIAVTENLGETWEEHPTSRGALIEPRCMASIHSHDYIAQSGEKFNILLFSNPNSKYRRHKQTIKISLDNGMTWPEKFWIELDEGYGAGYSCLTSIDEDTVGILYEGSQAQMTFQVLDLDEVLEGEL